MIKTKCVVLVSFTYVGMAMWGWHSICKIAQFKLIDSGASVFFFSVLVVVCFLLVLGTCYNNISRCMSLYVPVLIPCFSELHLCYWWPCPKKVVPCGLYTVQVHCAIIFLCLLHYTEGPVVQSLVLYWKSIIYSVRPCFDLKSPPKVLDGQCPTFTANVLGIRRSLVRC